MTGGPGRDPAGAYGIANVPGVTSSAKLLALGRGLYGLSIGQIAGERRDVVGLAVPATHITLWPAESLGGVEILTATGSAGWLGPEGGTIAVKIPSERGYLLITTYRLDGQAASPVEIRLTRMDRPSPTIPPSAAPSETAGSVAPGRGDHPARPRPTTGEVPIEIVLHIERSGDRRFAGGEWVGSRGQKLRIEAFSIRPLEKLTAAEVEYKAFGPSGRETPWVTAAKLCGTRGRGVPLTGFAVRLTAPASERFEVVYEGAFFESGAAGPRRNGEPCMPSKIDDALEAVNIRLVERTNA